MSNADQEEVPFPEEAKTAAAVKIMSLSQINDLYTKHLRQLVNGQTQSLMDICKLYPPEVITEAFEAAGAAGVQKLNWVRKRLESRKSQQDDDFWDNLGKGTAEATA